MIRLIRVGYIAILCMVLANCSGGALGMVGSPAWYMTASKEAIKEYESNGGSRRSASTSYNSIINTPSITSSRVSSSGRNIFNSDGTSSRISSNGRNIYHSDGTSSRISSNGRNIFNSDGTSSRISSNGRNIYNSDGTSCRISSSGRNMFCN